MNPRLTIRRPGRALAVGGALVAVSATAAMALVAGTASAAPAASRPGTCIDNVNVRAEPTTDSKIVAVCTAGKAVQVGETEAGFVRLTDLDGWAAQEYVSVNGAKPAPAARPSTADEPDADAAPTAGPTTPADPSDEAGGDEFGDQFDDQFGEPSVDDEVATPAEPRTTGSDNGNPLGSLLG
jgi:Bacterial SH3 domain